MIVSPRTLRACTGILSLLLAASRIAEAQSGNGSDVTGPPTTGSTVTGNPFISVPTSLGPISTNLSASVTGITTSATRLNVPAAIVPLVQQFVSGNLVSPVTQQTIPGPVASLVAILGAGRLSAQGFARQTLVGQLNQSIPSLKVQVEVGNLVKQFSGVLSSPTPSKVSSVAQQYNRVIAAMIGPGGSGFPGGELPAPLVAMHAVLTQLIKQASAANNTPARR